MYDISGQIAIDHKITKTVFRERLIEALQTLDADVDLADEDGAVEFRPALKNRGKHPLKNITLGRISLLTNDTNRLYVDEVRYQLSLIQMRISLVTISLVLWAYGLLRGYDAWLLLVFTALTWIFGYAISMITIKSRFQGLVETILG